ncbi:MAG: helix-turn-helix transcriptional regulator [Eubacteriales bacterium]|nr:helix-turn-helix transcriptional regulator [Eubacteriales bacterium]
MNIDFFRKNLKRTLQEKKITLNMLALQSDLSEDTLRSVIYGKSHDIKLSTVIKIADVLDCTIDDLVGRAYYSDLEREIHSRIHRFSQSSIKSIDYFTKYQEDLELKHSIQGKEIIPIFVPIGNMKEGMYCGNHNIEQLDITEYPGTLKEDVDFGIKVLTNCFEPIYYLNDILLCSCKRKPEINDIVLYFDHSGRLFLRKYFETHLEALNGFGERIPSYRFSEYTPKGVVLRVVKEFNIEQYR